MTNPELFLKLANPDEVTGISRVVYTSEFKGEFAALALGNGVPWTRSRIQKEYEIKKKYSKSKGHPLESIQLCGYRKRNHSSGNIRIEIKKAIKQRRCVICGAFVSSENTRIEPDHKNGRKNDPRVNNTATQRMDDFQPLCHACNMVKRQACKDCKKPGAIRWDAKNIAGNPVSYYKGGPKYTSELGCVGCYLYDPVEYRMITYAGKF